MKHIIFGAALISLLLTACGSSSTPTAQVMNTPIPTILPTDTPIAFLTSLFPSGQKIQSSLMIVADGTTALFYLLNHRYVCQGIRYLLR
jgi:hypothetical protein